MADEKVEHLSFSSIAFLEAWGDDVEVEGYERRYCICDILLNMNDEDPKRRKIVMSANDAIFQTAAYVRAIQSVFKLDSKVNKRIQEQIAPILQMMRRVRPYMDGLHKLTHNIQPAVHVLNELGKKYQPHLAAITEAMKQFEDFHAGLIERHKSEKLALSPFFNEITLPDLYEIFKDREKLAIEIYHDFFSERAHCELLLESWAENKFYEDRIPILRDAISAHIEGKYTLSIPVFLTQIEGVLCHVLNVRDHRKVRGRLNGVKLENEDELFGSAGFISSIVTEQVFHSSSYEKRETEYPRRHGILHGLDLSYFKDPHASVRCILLLDLLRAEKFLALNKNDDEKGEE